jgi:hypothetical protein
MPLLRCADKQCAERTAVRAAYVNGRKVGQVITRNVGPKNAYNGLAVNRLFKTVASLGSGRLQICFSIASPCETLTKLVRGGFVQYALFDRMAADGGQGCCPSTTLYLPGST